MNRLSLTLLIVFQFLAVESFSQDVAIKSLRAYTAGDETSLPIIHVTKTDRTVLTIEFDVNSRYTPDLNIVFRFCQGDWIPTDNLFLANTGKNIFYNLRFETLPSTVEDARYYFRGNFPDKDGYVTFPFSGKWMFYITDSFDTSIVYASGRFFVVHDLIASRVSFKKEQLEDKIYFPSDLAKVFNITAEFTIPDEMFPAFVDRMEIVENKKTQYPVIVDRTHNTNTRQFYWDANRRFSFSARDIRPGNGYRQADIRDINKFTGRNVRAQFDGLEYSRFFKRPDRDLNGGSKLTNYRDEFATYLNVTFSVRPPEEVTGRVFLTGAFNNWILSDEYLMDYNAGIHSLTIPLKRGVYDYQFVIADIINGEIRNPDWYVLEGNNWDNLNEYHVFIFYNDPEFGGYERIIAYHKIISR